MRKNNNLYFISLIAVLSFLFLSANTGSFHDSRVNNNTGILSPSGDSIAIKINQIAQYYMSDTGNVGLIIGIYRQRTDPNIPVPPEIYSYGHIRKDTNSPVPDSLTFFKLGSVEKTFCATILAKIILDTSLNVKLSDLINKFLPDTLMLPGWIDTTVTPHDTVYISLLDLVTHYSSLPDSPSNLVEPPGYTLKMLYQFLESYHDSLAHKPGTNWLYSNLGFGLLGDISAIIRNTSYSNEANAIFSSLGMIDTKIILTPKDTNRVAPGHSYNGNLIKHYLRHPSPALEGAGAHFSTMKDMLRFLSYNLGFMESPLNNLLDTLHKWRRDRNNQIHKGQAMAWEIDLLYPETSIYHIWKDGGSPDGYSSFITFRPETKTGVVVLSNSRNAVDSVGNVVLRNLNPLTTGIRILNSSVPENFVLHQNYPNPFNPITNIKFDLAEPGFVKLRIFDISGRLISVLVNEKLNAGSYGYKFDASHLSSGIYFYRIAVDSFGETGNFNNVKKMIIVK
jgi:CubicO group peptidase (beta-lactamase class C family)